VGLIPHSSATVRGRELAAIRKGKLYRNRYQTFEGYCLERWELTDRRAEQLMVAADFAEKANHGSRGMPRSERHVRPLLKLEAASGIGIGSIGAEQPHSLAFIDQHHQRYALHPRTIGAASQFVDGRPITGAGQLLGEFTVARVRSRRDLRNGVPD
jgi:hypothetical protein